MCKARALLVDLNNLARYPTLGIGYLVASLRGAGIEVEVLSPLLHGVPPSVRERPQTLKMHVRQRALFGACRCEARPVCLGQTHDGEVRTVLAQLQPSECDEQARISRRSWDLRSAGRRDRL